VLGREAVLSSAGNYCFTYRSWNSNLP